MIQHSWGPDVAVLPRHPVLAGFGFRVPLERLGSGKTLDVTLHRDGLETLHLQRGPGRKGLGSPGHDKVFGSPKTGAGSPTGSRSNPKP